MKIFIRCIIVAILVFVTASVYSFDNMDRQIGIIYLRNAAAYYLSEQYVEAEKFLEKTSEFHSTSSDYEYLYGLIKLEKENHINEAADYFERAIKNGDWILLDKKECVTDLAQILFRKKEYLKLIDIVEQEAYPDYNDNDLMYLYLLSLKYEGRSALYSTLLKRSIDRYSDDYRFAELYVNESSRYRDEVINGQHDYKNEDGRLKVILAAAMTLEDSGYKLRIIENYLRDGGKEVGAMIEKYRLRGKISDIEFENLLKEKIFENPENLPRLYNILPDLEMRRKLRDAYSQYTGNIYYDFNKDGYFEELHLYELGRPVGVSIDQNQDGNIEVMTIFSGDSPVEVILSDEKFIRISYGIYPHVKDLSIAKGTEREVYTFFKDRVELPVFEMRSSDDKLIFLKKDLDDFLKDQSLIRDSAVKISSYTGGNSKDNYGYLRNELERRDEMYSVLKVYDEIIGNFVYQQYNDMRTNGFGDIDFDNLIDLKETYFEGKIVSIETDDNKNGIYDFKITFESDRSISWWDFNEDGLYDCRQYYENGVLINEYSSRFDGNFDIIERN